MQTKPNTYELMLRSLLNKIDEDMIGQGGKRLNDSGRTLAELAFSVGWKACVENLIRGQQSGYTLDDAKRQVDQAMLEAFDEDRRFGGCN